ncbi:MAG: ClpXP protease specificity-enhancing factor SspB [Magnetococcus sp. DMHC-6]
MDKITQPSKGEVIRLLLEQEGRVMLHLDATRQGVVVPRRFNRDIGLRLVLNKQMPQPIDIGSSAIKSELRFGGIPHYCILPFLAIWGAVNPDTGHGMFWPESMPLSIRHDYESHLASGSISPPLPSEEKSASVEVLPVKRKKPELHVVETDPLETTDSNPPPPSRPPPKLRLVK